MSDFIFEENHSEDSIIQSKLKDFISSWSNRIPHHNLRNFGEIIDIKSVYNRPAYYLVLKSQLEKREVHEEFKPFDGQPLPPKKYHSVSEIDIWAEQFSNCNSFTNYEESNIVEGSQYKLICEPCLGEGRVPCPTCNGEKQVDCGKCSGKGSRQCQTCRGSGQIESSCPNCNGGYKSKWDHQEQRNVQEKCSSCSGGRIRKTCSTCGGNRRVPCQTCNRTGKVPCKPCRATGKVQCLNCKGKGKLYYFYKIVRTLSIDENTEEVFHDEVTEHFPNLEIETDYLNGLSVSNNKARLLVDDLFEESDSIQSSFKDLQKITLANRNSNTKLLFQNIEIFKWDVYHVSYEFDDEQFEIALHGPNFTVNAPENPISRVRTGFKEDAEKKIANKKYVEAYDLLTKAEGMDTENEDDSIAELKIQTYDKISSFGSWGSFLAIIAFGYLFWNLTTSFLAENTFFLPYFNELYTSSDWMPQIHPISTAVVFFLFSITILAVSNGDYHQRFFKENIDSNVLRVVLGFGTMAMYMALFWVALMVANYAGITLIFTYIGYALHAIWEFVAGILT